MVLQLGIGSGITTIVFEIDRTKEMLEDKFKFTADELYEYKEDNYGICLACGELREKVEPDAEGYECYDCGKYRVVGIEQALIMGRIEIVEDNNE